MDEERRNKIAAALRQYRETVLERNLAFLRILLDGLEKQLMPKTQPPSGADVLRLWTFKNYGFFSIPESVKELRDILNDDVRAYLIKWNRLDGVCDTSISSEKREEWFSKIKANIAKKNIGLDNIEIPEDLVELCNLIDGIIGTGLPYYTEPHQIALLNPSGELRGLDYIVVPTWNEAGEREDELFEVWEDWEIAVAFQIGTGSFALCGSCAIYCRHPEDDDNKEWKWRYGMFDGDWHSDMCNSIEEFLAFYTHYNEQTEEGVRKDIPRLSYERMTPRTTLH